MTFHFMSTEPTIRRLRKALRQIRAQLDPHTDDGDNEIKQDPECFCIRCIAVRALAHKV